MTVWDELTREQRVWVVHGHIASAIMAARNNLVKPGDARIVLGSALIYLTGRSQDSYFTVGKILEVGGLARGLDGAFSGPPWASDAFFREVRRLAREFVDGLDDAKEGR